MQFENLGGIKDYMTEIGKSRRLAGRTRCEHYLDLDQVDLQYRPLCHDATINGMTKASIR